MPVHLYINLGVYVGTVAIKVATGIGSTYDAIHDPVWREAQVSGANSSYLALILQLCGMCVAMMSMQNECLVKLLGAGVMPEPEHGLRVLFTVQVFVLDAILLFFRSVSFQFCTGVHVRRRIRSKDMEPAPVHCDMGRETAVMQGYSQGMAPSTGTRH